MSLTLFQLVDAVEQVWGRTHDPRLDAVRTVNEAGRHLFAMHQWGWATRPSVVLATVAGQSYLALPDDVEAVISIASGDSLQYGIHLTTPVELAALRGSTIPPLFTFWVCLAQDDQATDEDAPPRPRLDIYPTPTSDSAASFLLTYRAKWRELSEDRHVANVPATYSGLLTQLVRAFATQALLPGSDAIERIQFSPSTKSLMASDGMRQGTLGRHTGGAIERLHTRRLLNYGPVSGPSQA